MNIDLARNSIIAQKTTLKITISDFEAFFKDFHF
jgi:hypothetical protein